MYKQQNNQRNYPNQKRSSSSYNKTNSSYSYRSNDNYRKQEDKSYNYNSSSQKNKYTNQENSKKKDYSSSCRTENNNYNQQRKNASQNDDKNKDTSKNNQQIKKQETIPKVSRVGKDPSKKIKTDKEEQILGKFYIEGFKWFRNKETGKESLKLCSFPSDFDVDSFKQFRISSEEKINIFGIKIHAVIEKYFKTKNENAFEELLKLNFNIKQQKALQFIVQSTETYLKKKGMKELLPEEKINYDKSYKQIDLLGLNENEAVLVDWKFTSEKSSSIIENEQSAHFYNQLDAVEKKFKKLYNNEQFKASILVIPLKRIVNFKFVEYSKEEIIQRQIGQETKSRFRKQKIIYTRIEMLKNLKKLKQKYKIDLFLQKPVEQESKLTEKQKINMVITNVLNKKKCTIIEQAKQIVDSNDQAKIDYFLNLDNASPFRYTNNPSKNYNLPSINLFDQFYIMHVLFLDSQNDGKSLLNSTIKQYIDVLPDKFKTELQSRNIKILQQEQNQSQVAITHYNKYIFEQDFTYYYDDSDESMSDFDGDSDSSNDYYDSSDDSDNDFYYTSDSDSNHSYGYKFYSDSQSDSSYDSDDQDQSYFNIDSDESDESDQYYTKKSYKHSKKYYYQYDSDDSNNYQSDSDDSNNYQTDSDDSNDYHNPKKYKKYDDSDDSNHYDDSDSDASNIYDDSDDSGSYDSDSY